jgi:ketosteroid isomerase-like protein
MRSIILPALMLFTFSIGFAQSDVRKLVSTEQAFAKLAAEKDARTAFLANMTDDAVVFIPQMTNAKANWTAKQPSKYLLSWAPNFADISNNGILGYTTGNWEFRAKGKDDTPTGFGDFITLWLRQPDGSYKWVVDIGTEHEKPEKYLNDWTTAAPVEAPKNSTVKPTADGAEEFYRLTEKKGIVKAYETFSDDNIRSYRDKKLPILGKKDVLKLLKDDKAKFAFAKRSTAFMSGDISYNLAPYTRTLNGKTENGNFLQIWKFYNGRWHIVLDIFKPLEQ